jgi:hypothetical protein
MTDVRWSTSGAEPKFQGFFLAASGTKGASDANPSAPRALVLVFGRGACMRMGIMRWTMALSFWGLLCLGLAGCSGSEAIPESSPSAPDPATMAKVVEQVAREGKLPPPLQASPLQAAAPVSPAPWMICLKSIAPDQNRRLAVFMNGKGLVAFREGVLIDRCESETYNPLKTP